MRDYFTDVDNLNVLREKLNAMLAADRIKYYGGVKKSWIQYAEMRYWDESLHELRLKSLIEHGFTSQNHSILDMAAGCGQFVMIALKSGYKCKGIEPEPWKLDFIRTKAKLSGYPTSWAEQILQGKGEKLPFDDDSFDCVTSFQTLEHVDDPYKVIIEMIRVTRVGGGIILRCPDYCSTYEAHYRIPWFPMFPRYAAKLYLKIIGRPCEGLDNIRYTTRGKIISWITKYEKQNDAIIVITDNNRIMFDNALRRKKIPHMPGVYILWSLLKHIKYFGRKEMSVNLFLRIIKK
jgi:ubiquinone/menaquinone biosynthesis C-methylase UbiE